MGGQAGPYVECAIVAGGMPLCRSKANRGGKSLGVGPEAVPQVRGPFPNCQVRQVVLIFVQSLDSVCARINI